MALRQLVSTRLLRDSVYLPASAPLLGDSGCMEIEEGPYTDVSVLRNQNLRPRLAMNASRFIFSPGSVRLHYGRRYFRCTRRVFSCDGYGHLWSRRSNLLAPALLVQRVDFRAVNPEVFLFLKTTKRFSGAVNPEVFLFLKTTKCFIGGLEEQ
ncbi:hypothetical protein NDU88_006323 [Pleurodeles waltl]|uniref:Uncharacterized protein n=1 Tax=Pleurodeles waltl TaxID=8319 RepID=A0AAV7X1C1_PLEWA|nr:hypothetical protein NDU88_006323 [Pleurodeles waltl]